MTNFIIFSACGLWIATAFIVAFGLHARIARQSEPSTQARRLLRAIPRAAGPGAFPAPPHRLTVTIPAPSPSPEEAEGEISRPYLLWERFHPPATAPQRDRDEQAAHLVRPYIIGTPHQLAAANEHRRIQAQSHVASTLAERTLAGLQELKAL
ncbi:hypothetical protein ACFO4E_15070 [Nocardiopsis mangrovi]|uniref:Uncharacterized protein n=1 Tax=Nocardiopsis mangrovi TaxID=1179818 RepID=A0ABV9DXW6_9ACTN